MPRRAKRNAAVAINARPTTTPITMPAIAPLDSCLEDAPPPGGGGGFGMGAGRGAVGCIEGVEG